MRPLRDLLRPEGDNPRFVEPCTRTLEEGLGGALRALSPVDSVVVTP
ncbi:hypothetical protein [Streptomyces sp. NRRL F-2580]|nr:hypothetical protein [Streptomyces sp. NRRL F-2580]